MSEKEIVYVIVYGNYSPSEIASIHRTREGAEKALAELNKNERTMWEIAEMELEP